MGNWHRWHGLLRTTSLHRFFCILVSAALGAVAAPAMVMADAPAGPPRGVVADPCVGVPARPTPEQLASGNVWEEWTRAWMALDWAQRCRYAAENASLPKASRQRVVFLGDSITEAWKEQHPQFFEGEIIDRGIGGQTTEQMMVRFRVDVLDLHPAVLHLMAGTNDVAGNHGPTTLAIIEGNLQSMIEDARAHGIAVIVASVPPAHAFSWAPSVNPVPSILALNVWLKAYAHREHLVYVDYYSLLSDGHDAMKAEYSEDGVHPNKAGYAAIEGATRQAIKEALAKGH